MIPPLLFTLSFMFISVLLALGVIFSRIAWTIKALLVLSTLLFSGFFYKGYVGSLGYPAPIDPPPIFRFIYGIVHEPSTSRDDPGAVYIWFETDGSVPRVMLLPYSAESRKMMAQAKKKLQEGQTVYMGRAVAATSSKPRGTQPSAAAPSPRPGGGPQHKSSVPYNVEGGSLMFKDAPDNVPQKELEE